MFTSSLYFMSCITAQYFAGHLAYQRTCINIHKCSCLPWLSLCLTRQSIRKEFSEHVHQSYSYVTGIRPNVTKS
ncbi:hypothetical protein HZ326_9785 [Fusarium oxysporum f. sp. albedinis]|nr:hypothetical protein HZ326_9785 [Fusarium oxysporum f. sp. albedinis]